MKDKTEKKNSFLRYLERIKGKREQGEDVDENSVKELNDFVQEDEKRNADAKRADEKTVADQNEDALTENPVTEPVLESSDSKEEETEGKLEDSSELEEDAKEEPSVSVEESQLETEEEKTEDTVYSRELEKPTIIFDPVVHDNQKEPVKDENIWDSRSFYLEEMEDSEKTLNEDSERKPDFVKEENENHSKEIEDIVAEESDYEDSKVVPSPLPEEESIGDVEVGIGEAISIEDMKDDEELEKDEIAEIEEGTNQADDSLEHSEEKFEEADDDHQEEFVELPKSSLESSEEKFEKVDIVSLGEKEELPVSALENEAKMEQVPENLFQETPSHIQGKQKRTEEFSSLNQNLSMPILISLIRQAQALDKTIQKQEEERRKIEQKLQENQDRYRDFLIQIRTMADDQLSSLDSKSTKKM